MLFFLSHFRKSKTSRSYTFANMVYIMAKPFLKWAGGKRQLIPEIEKRLPDDIATMDTYLEPFIGAGAVLFHLIEKYNFKNLHVFDVNSELILCYNAIKDSADNVWMELESLIKGYLPLNPQGRKEFYYMIRDSWNNVLIPEITSENIIDHKRAAMTIFLNKTCFNGLFRVNGKGEFNVPHGRYKKPSFPSREELVEVGKALQNVNIHLSSFEDSIEYVHGKTFAYFDPPYRPLSETSGFVSYTKGQFNDEDQIKLSDLVKQFTNLGAKVLLSNSDPKNTNPEDNFFDELYSDFIIDRIDCNRSINSVGNSRGPIKELLIRN